MGLSLIIFTKVFLFDVSLVFNILWKLIQIDIRNTDYIQIPIGYFKSLPIATHY